MPVFRFTGTLILENVTFEVAAPDEKEARQLIREGIWDDRNDDEADIKKVTIKKRRPPRGKR